MRLVVLLTAANRVSLRSECVNGPTPTQMSALNRMSQRSQTFTFSKNKNLNEFVMVSFVLFKAL